MTRFVACLLLLLSLIGGASLSAQAQHGRGRDHGRHDYHRRGPRRAVVVRPRRAVVVRQRPVIVVPRHRR